MSLFFGGIILGLIYILLKNAIPYFWRIVTKTRWKEVRRKDAIGLLLVLGFIFLAEFFLPSMEVFGRKEFTIADQSQPLGSQLNWPKELPPINELAELKPWLMAFSQEAGVERNEKLKRLKDEYELLTQLLASTSAEYAITKEAYDSDNLSTLKQKKAAETHKRFRKVESKIRRLYRQIEQTETLNEIYESVHNFVKFKQPIAIIHETKKANFESSKRIDYSKDAISLWRKNKVEGPLIPGGWEISTGIAKYLYLSLKGTYLPVVESKRIFSCNISFIQKADTQVMPEKYCEISVPLPPNYDLAYPDCDRANKVHISKSEAFCLERWNVPQFNIRLFEDRLLIAEPKALNKDYEFLDTLTNSRWEVEIAGKRIPLNGKTKIELPDNLEALNKLKLWHIPVNKKVRIFSNIDINLDWFGNSEEKLTGVELDDRLGFKQIAYDLEINEDLSFAWQFLDKTKAPEYGTHSLPELYAEKHGELLHYTIYSGQHSEHIASKLDEMKKALANYAALADPNCSMVSSHSSPSLIEKVNILAKHTSLMALNKPDSSDPDCGKLSVVMAFVENFKSIYQPASQMIQTKPDRL
ncbi:MAG: hypothetical protein GY761_13210 [Hyphomicrobiales bacterium]|nr:hypothetical protein [Hyphomicrobiales bacterium]